MPSYDVTTVLGTVMTSIVISMWIALGIKRRLPTFVSSYGTRVWSGGFPINVAEFEKIQDAILRVYPSIKEAWTPGAIRKSFGTLRVKFVPMPIRTRTGIASGITDPYTGDLLTLCFVVPISDSAFAHEFIHTLCIQVDRVSNDDDINHRNWSALGYYQAIEEVRKRARI